MPTQKGMKECRDAYIDVKSNDSPYYKNKYQRISKRRGKKRAIIAIARMILTAVFHMFKTGEFWNPTETRRYSIYLGRWSTVQARPL